MNNLENVREGMDVVDATGDVVGTVKFVKMGDPEATTAEGQLTGDRDGLLDVIADAFTGGEEPPQEMQERLLRLGYIEVDATGIGGDFAVPADRVAEVSDETVRLSVRRADA